MQKEHAITSETLTDFFKAKGIVKTSRKEIDDDILKQYIDHSGDLANDIHDWIAQALKDKNA